MSAKKTSADYAKEAAHAMAQLHVMGCVQDMLENGTVRDAESAARRIIAIASAERRRQLRIYDRALARIAKETP